MTAAEEYRVVLQTVSSNLQPSGYERRNLAGKISKYRHFCMAEVRAKREGKGCWGSWPAGIRKSVRHHFRPPRHKREGKGPLGELAGRNSQISPPSFPPAAPRRI
jgi:hypothetical protein